MGEKRVRSKDAPREGIALRILPRRHRVRFHLCFPEKLEGALKIAVLKPYRSLKKRDQPHGGEMERGGVPSSGVASGLEIVAEEILVGMANVGNKGGGGHRYEWNERRREADVQSGRTLLPALPSGADRYIPTCADPVRRNWHFRLL